MAATDVIDVEVAREALRERTAKHETLQRLVSAVSHRFDDEFGAVVQRSVTSEKQPTRGLEAVMLDYYPATSVTATLDGVSVTPDVDEDWGLLFHPTDARWPVSRKPNLTVSYTAGRFADTDAVTPEFVEAAVITIRHLWHAANPATVDAGEFDYVGPTFPRFILPNAAAELLRRYRRPTPAIG